jgi:hypothetical protein
MKIPDRILKDRALTAPQVLAAAYVLNMPGVDKRASLIGIAHSARLPSTDHARIELDQLVRLGIIAGYTADEKSAVCRLNVDAVEGADMFGGEETQIWKTILDHWNRQAVGSNQIVRTRQTSVTASQRTSIKKRWKSEIFRNNWRRTIRIVMVSPFYEAKRVSIGTFIGTAPDGNSWVSWVSRIWDESAKGLSDAKHCVLFPWPGSGAKVAEDEWNRWLPIDREKWYAKPEALGL